VKKIWADIDKILVGGVTVVVVLIVGFLWYVYGSDTKISMGHLSLVIIVFYVACIVIYAICKNKNTATFRLPRVRAIDKSDALRFIVEKSEWYNTGALVSIYHQQPDTGMERPLGVGRVETITESGNSQIIFMPQNNEHNDLIDKLQNNEKDCNAIKIKPTIQGAYISWL